MKRARPCLQKGVILLGLMIALLLASGFYFISHANRMFGRQSQDAADTATLQKATEALVARAVSDANHPGSLPCPAPNSDGTTLGVIPCPSNIGWLPWRTLDLPDLRDSSGERLWYVLSPAFQDTGIINSNSVSSLTLDGVAGVSALVIAPGAALVGQNRPSNNPADYLDAWNGNPLTSNNDGNDSYFSGPSGGKFNDKVLPLRTATLFTSVSRRILGEIRFAFATGGGVAPYADALPIAPAISDGLSNPLVDIGLFPYRNPAYINIDSPSSPGQFWYTTLENNGWLALVTYNRVARTISLNGQVQILP